MATAESTSSARDIVEPGDASRRRVVVIGGGPAAHRFSEAMHARSVLTGATATRFSVTVIGEEEHLPYDRVALSRRLVGSEDLTLGDRTLWDSSA
ncbi:MAG TPA: hypothetical protein DCP11_11175, partial [Microbacteriaceae bacterium]|nr:hypothetical protein [Microbacteriaceae bacterium]